MHLESVTRNWARRLAARAAPALLLATTLLAATLQPASVRADDFMDQIGVYLPTFFAELQDVELANGRAYIFGVGGFGIMDVDDPAKPALLGRYQPLGHPYNRYYRGAVGTDYAYGGAREDLLSVIDITDEANPYLVTTVGTSGQSYEGALVHGSFLYAARHPDGIEILSLADPANPNPVASILTLTNAWDLDIDSNHAFVADGTGGLAVIDVSTPAAPVHLYSLSTAGAALDVEVAGGLAYVACGSAGVEIFDVTSPGSGYWIGNYNSSGLAVSLDVDGDRLYLADWDDVEVVDLTYPESPSRVGWENTPVRAMGLAASGDIAYVADWSRFRVYDFGATTTGDVDLQFEEIAFGLVPVGSTVDTTFTIFNTGGGTLQVTDVQSFGANFVVLPPTSFAIAPGASHDTGLQFNHASPGYDATFIRIDSDDPDEGQADFPVSADDDPSYLDLGETAPAFTHQDTDNNSHSLSDYLGKVVVMAFFANW